MGRRKKDKRRRIDPPQKQEMSQIIWEFAEDFIRMGDTPERKQSLLNAACSAWNMACGPPEFREKSLKAYVREYRRLNPSADEEDLADVRSDAEKLMQKKLAMFPNDLRRIVGARIFPAGDRDRIEIMSARIE
jgi:hypothetical protein